MAPSLVSDIVLALDLEPAIDRRNPDFLWCKMVFLDDSVDGRDYKSGFISHDHLWMLTVLGAVVCAGCYQDIHEYK